MIIEYHKTINLLDDATIEPSKSKIQKIQMNQLDLTDSNGIQTDNRFIHNRMLNHLAKLAETGHLAKFQTSRLF